jgi:hypothetical protein
MITLYIINVIIFSLFLKRLYIRFDRDWSKIDLDQLDWEGLYFILFLSGTVSIIGTILLILKYLP